MKNTLQQLTLAEEHFYSCRLVEAYHIFRRYFDRIPFCIEDYHSKYIGMFVRVLLELGKINELKFYVSALEKHYRTSTDPEIAYPLAVAYMSLPEPQTERAKEILERIMLDPGANEFRNKAKMMLATYYDGKKNTAVCRKLIFSINTEDVYLRLLVGIWRAKVYRDEGKLLKAREELHSVMLDIDRDKHWYAHYSAKIIEAGLALMLGEIETTKKIVSDILKLYDVRQYKSLKEQLDELETRIRDKSEMGVMQVETRSESGTRFIYERRTMHLKQSSPAAKLLDLFLKKGFLDKCNIMETLYERNYEGIPDDRLIYYHIHALRKRLKSIGLPSGSISNESNGYRFHPKVEYLKEERQL